MLFRSERSTNSQRVSGFGIREVDELSEGFRVEELLQDSEHVRSTNSQRGWAVGEVSVNSRRVCDVTVVLASPRTLVVFDRRFWGSRSTENARFVGRSGKICEAIYRSGSLKPSIECYQLSGGPKVCRGGKKNRFRTTPLVCSRYERVYSMSSMPSEP